MLRHAFFFFQAEDGIRDVAVTGVQTCDLPISLTLPGNAQVVIASWQVRTLLDGLLKKCLRSIQLLLLERFHSLEDKQLGLRQARTKLVQGVQLIEFLVSAGNIPLLTQSNTQVVVCHLEIRFQLDRPPKSSDCAGRVSAGN